MNGSYSITSTRTLAAVGRPSGICGFVAVRTTFGMRAVVSAKLKCGGALVKKSQRRAPKPIQ